MNTHTLLQQSRQEYEINVFSLWLRWCEKHAHNASQLQALLSNAPLFNWWQANLKTYELIFKQEISLYRLECPPAVLHTTWQEYTSVILKIHSPVLIKQALNSPKTATNDPSRN